MTLDPHAAYITSAFKYLAGGGKLDGLSDAEEAALRKSGDLHTGPRARLTLRGLQKLEQQRQIEASHARA